MSKADKRDDLGNRMKRYELKDNASILLPGIPVYTRIDGRAFSTLTKGLERPFCKPFHDIMTETTKVLVGKTHALFGYTQSDEISLVHLWPSHEQMFFGGRQGKLNSVFAGIASSAFVIHAAKSEISSEINFDRYPHFDSRTVNLPSNTEATNMIYWRWRDARKNAINGFGRSQFSQKELHGVSNQKVLERMKDLGYDFEDQPNDFKNGSFIFSRVTERKVPNEDGTGEITVNRHVTEVVDLPPLNMVANRTAVFFEGAEPILKK